MDKKIAGLVGAISAVAAAGAAQASTGTAVDLSQVLTAQSYADLLQPIPNALALLQAADAERARSAGATSPDDMQVAQYDHHHHHHHHYPRVFIPRYYEPRYHHHHYRYYGHHHHHHHHYYNNDE